MNGCNEVQAGLTEYLDGRLSGREMQEVDAHLQRCSDCAQEWKSLRDVQASLAVLGPVPVPAELPLRIRVAVSQERMRGHRISMAWAAGMEEYAGTVSAAGRRWIRQRGGAAGNRCRPGYCVCAAADGPGYARRASGQCDCASSALFLECVRQQ